MKYDSLLESLEPLVNITDGIINEGYEPEFVMGLVMVIIAKQFERFNYRPEHFLAFLEHSKTLVAVGEPVQHKRPVLTLIKNENFTSSTSADS